MSASVVREKTQNTEAEVGRRDGPGQSSRAPARARCGAAPAYRLPSSTTTKNTTWRICYDLTDTITTKKKISSRPDSDDSLDRTYVEAIVACQHQDHFAALSVPPQHTIPVPHLDRQSAPLISCPGALSRLTSDLARRGKCACSEARRGGLEPHYSLASIQESFVRTPLLQPHAAFPCGPPLSPPVTLVWCGATATATANRCASLAWQPGPLKRPAPRLTCCVCLFAVFLVPVFFFCHGYRVERRLSSKP